MLSQEKLTEFLKEYAKELQSDFDWSSITPCRCSVKMAAGAVFVLTKSGECMASFHTHQDDYDPSMPITKRDVAAGRLFEAVVNLLGKEKKNENQDKAGC